VRIRREDKDLLKKLKRYPRETPGDIVHRVLEESGLAARVREQPIQVPT
jgi:hypothetical protein